MTPAYKAAMNDIRAAALSLGIGRDATVAQAEKLLMPHYCRVNGTNPSNKFAISRVSAAAHDLIERNVAEPWVAHACATAPAA